MSLYLVWWLIWQYSRDLPVSSYSTCIAHWLSKFKSYWRLAAYCAVTMLAEDDLDRMWWTMGSRVGSLFECFLVAMCETVGGLVGVACGGWRGTLVRRSLVRGLWANLGGDWGHCEHTIGYGLCINGAGLVAEELGSLCCKNNSCMDLRVFIWGW